MSGIRYFKFFKKKKINQFFTNFNAKKIIQTNLIKFKKISNHRSS